MASSVYTDSELEDADIHAAGLNTMGDHETIPQGLESYAGFGS